MHVVPEDKRKLLELVLKTKRNELFRLKGNDGNTVYINESGLYSLILRSKLESAKEFKRWVTSQVLPSIRMLTISMMSKCGYTDKELLEYIEKHNDEIECELNGEVYEEPKKHKSNFCIDCKLRKIVDYERSTSVCTKCGVFEYFPMHVMSYNHSMKPSRRKCIYKRYDNFKVILNQFFYGGKRVVPDDIMETIRDEIHDETNILYSYEIPITIPILECILKRKGLTRYKDSIYFIYFKLSGVPFTHITTKEYNMVLNVFNVVSNIYNKYKPKGRKSFLNYSFVLKKILIILGKVEYAKYIPKLKTNSKQKELDRVWELITKDPEWVAALQKQKIV